ncbi:hypothetical protein SAICODRAFT_69561 [Saitoella complicata NRRL Y-17804]|nr:uncharacterized protein SAICODRAFT_69561 [Saitoella complicata NRRL Y-17804]ODQ54909.1 hypothetical protein SAICODRAFT_69561 [Saitoella complicata NRRL Y-17804]
MFYAPQSYASGSAGPSLFDLFGAGQQRPYTSSPYHYEDDEYNSDPYEDEYVYSPFARQRQHRKPEVEYLRDPYTGQIYAHPLARKAQQSQPKKQPQEFETQYFRDPYTGQIYARQVPVKRAPSPRTAAQPSPKPQALTQTQRQQQPKKEEVKKEEYWVPTMDVYSNPTHLTLHFALPGLRKDDLELEYDPRSDRLYIGGVIHAPQQHSSSTPEIKERKVGKFERVVELERYLDDEEDVGKRFAHEGVEARVEDGVVEIRVPKVEVRKQRVW